LDQRIGHAAGHTGPPLEGPKSIDHRLIQGLEGLGAAAVVLQGRIEGSLSHAVAGQYRVPEVWRVGRVEVAAGSREVQLREEAGERAVRNRPRIR
jgi:hypothetical protein